jgi:hypothetical protein
MRAQRATSLDSARLAAMQGVAMQQSQPVDFVLQLQSDLVLTRPQITALTALRAALTDSATVRQARRVAQLRGRPTAPALIAVSGWTGDLDEVAIQTALCQQAGVQAEGMLTLARDRRAVAALLTPAQVAQLSRLQTSDMMGAVKRR